jgi:Pro-kumamolisin, activation domain/Abnormal spindle-like microcephaly-assoc'd, ASPM-SPD-2-Hydin
MRNDSRKFATRLMIVSCLPLVALLVLGSGTAWAQEPQVSGSKNLPAFTNTPRPVREGSAPLVEAYNPASKLRLAISIKAPKMDEEEAFLKQLKDKSSPNFHKYLSPEEWNARFAPSIQDEQAVVDWVTSQGLTVTARYPNRLMVNVEGTVDTIQKALNIHINRYQVNGTTEFSNDRDPSIPADLTGIVEFVDGLNSIMRMRPANSRMNGVRGPDYAPGPMHQIGERVHVSADSAAAQAIKPSGGQIGSQITNGFYDPTDFWSQQGYNYNALQAQGHCCNPLDNANQTPPETTIGLATDGDFADSDMAGFQNQYPYLAYHYGRVFVDGTPAGGDDETTLDLEWTTATSNSRGSYVDTSLIWVYEAAQGFGDFGTLFQQMVNDNNVRVVNISYGLSETVFLDDAPSLLTSWHSIFNQMIGQGWTIMAASGDGGSDAGCTGSLAVLYPESDPDVTSVGGTELFLNSDGSFNTEVAWTGGTYSGACSHNNGGGGGGCSAVWSAPGYQVNPYCGSSSRSVPDVSLNAGVGTNFFFNGSLSGVGGTSLASPLMSGFIAQENAYSLSMGNACDGTHNCAPIGQVDYDIYAEGGYNMSAPHYPFYDITSGCTSNDTISSAWCASPGYDLATGWGSFNALQMAWAINWEDNLAYAAPSVSFSGPATNTWYNSDQTVSWSVNANGNPTGIAGFTQGWDSIPSDFFSDTNRNHSNSFFSGPQFPNATTGCLELAGGGSCAGGVSQGCHTAHVRAWSNQGSTSGDVTYGPVCYDTIPPRTTATVSGTPISGTSYKSAVTVTLSASDTGSGVAATYYALNSGGCKAYSGPFTVGYTGAYTVHFYSVDKAGNTATPSSVSFTIKPAVSVSPATLAFGNQVLGTPGAGKSVTVTNITGSSVSLSAPEASGDYTVSGSTCGASLAAGAHCSITVTFKPSIVGSVSGDLTVAYSGGVGSPDRIGLSGTGLVPLAASPTSLAFGTVTMGNTSPSKTLTLKNDNPSTALSINVAYSKDYAAATGGTCGASLAGGTSCTVNVAFTPHQNGAINGAVSVTDNVAQSPLVVALSGSGSGFGASPLTFSPTSASFTNVVLGTSSSKSVTVKNVSASSVKITSALGSGDYSASGCVTTLLPSATCVLTVNFKPSTSGPLKGAIAVTNNNSVNPDVLDASGTAILPVTISPTSVNLGSWVVGKTSSSATVTVTNHTASAVSIAYPASGDFSAVSGGGTPCSSSLAAGAQCTFLVSATPTTTGAISGVVTVTYSAGYSPQEVKLSATGQ